jgi:type IV pilus assembly protein PilV
MKNYLANRQSGFSMIEVLVAVLILAIGLLGVAAIQTTALKNNNSALQRSQATMLAYFMMDAMRANRSKVPLNEYDLGETCITPSIGSLATNDQNAWFTALKANLGNVSTTCGEINCDDYICTVKVYWQDKRGLSGSDEEGITNELVEITSRL